MHMTEENDNTGATKKGESVCAHEELCIRADKSGTVVITETTLKEALLRNDEEWQKRLLLAVLIMLIIVVGQ
jgi:hypothetical protein